MCVNAVVVLFRLCVLTFGNSFDASINWLIQLCQTAHLDDVSLCELGLAVSHASFIIMFSLLSSTSSFFLKILLVI